MTILYGTDWYHHRLTGDLRQWAEQHGLPILRQFCRGAGY